jgi:hypothetical protein
MSFIEILDGNGDGYRAKVNSNKRLETFSVGRSRMADVSQRNGEAFLLTTDFISLTTTASFSGLIYIKNTNPDKILFIDKIRICGTGTMMGYAQTKFLKNPTLGTLISDANTGITVPSNLSSNVDFGGTNYSASGDGKTVTDGTQFSQFSVHLPGHTIQEYDGSLILEGGASMAVLVKPSYATEICVEIQCWTENK